MPICINSPPKADPQRYSVSQELANACMSADARARPSFSVIVHRLATLRGEEEDHRLEPRGGFAVYHGWQQEVA